MQWDVGLNHKLLALKMKCQSQVYKKVSDFLCDTEVGDELDMYHKNHTVIRSVLFHQTPLSYLDYFMLLLPVFKGNFNFFG
jgi:hypothetical protein